MADQKISALPAVAVVAATNEFAVNEAGSSKKASAAQLRDFFTRLVSGNSGAANTASAPSETWQVLTSNATANATSTLATVMTTTGVSAGVYRFEYHVVYQSSATGQGVQFAINFTGTITRVRVTRVGQTSGSSPNGVADQIITSTNGGTVQAWADRTNGALLLGPSTGVDTANADQYETINGLLVVSTTGNLELQHASESATSTQVMADTCLFLKRLV